MQLNPPSVCACVCTILLLELNYHHHFAARPRLSPSSPFSQRPRRLRREERTCAGVDCCGREPPNKGGQAGLSGIVSTADTLNGRKKYMTPAATGSADPQHADVVVSSLQASRALIQPMMKLTEDAYEKARRRRQPPMRVDRMLSVVGGQNSAEGT